MDPLSATASIIAVIQLSSKIVQYIATAKGGTKDRQRLRNEIQACDDVLQVICDNSEDSEKDEKSWSSVIGSLEAPGALLDQIRMTLVMIEQKLRSGATGNHLIQSVKWPFQEKEVDKLVALIHRQVSLLQMILLNENRKLDEAIHQISLEIKSQLALLNETLTDSSNKVQAQVEGLTNSVNQFHIQHEERESIKEWSAILDWISPAAYAQQYTDLIYRRQTDTGQWFFKSNKFQYWVDHRKQTLFCPGIPGAGKTTLAAGIIDHLTTKFGQDRTIGIAYVFCNYRQKDEQTALYLLSSILKQFHHCSKSKSVDLKALYDQCQESRTRPSVDNIVKLLGSVTSKFSRSYIIVDALDECNASDQYRPRLVQELLCLQEKHNVNLLATSRNIPYVIDRFSRFPCLEIRAESQDLRLYIMAQIQNLPDFITRNKVLTNDIVETITKAADGMFLLAEIYLNSLNSKPTIKAIRVALDHFRHQTEGSSGSNKEGALTPAYESVMGRITAQKHELASLALQVLSWITFARKQLTTKELQNALAVELQTTSFDEENIPDIGLLITICMGLIVVDSESGLVRLTHYTTQKFLEHEGGRWLPEAQKLLASTCLTYLSYDEFSLGYCLSNLDYRTRVRRYPFYVYAAQNWGYHAAFLEDCHEVIDFIHRKGQFEGSIQCLFVGDHSYDSNSQSFPGDTKGLHLLAYFGLVEAAKTIILEDAASIDQENDYNRTPLSYAAERGNQALVELLLENGANYDSVDDTGMTPLLRAVLMRHDNVLESLAKIGAKIDFINPRRLKSSLAIAAELGYQSVVSILTKYTTQFNIQDRNGRTPISLAAGQGHDAIVKILYEHGAQIDFFDVHGFSPLMYAAFQGHINVVKFFIDKGIKINHTDHLGMTALHHAARGGFADIAQLLIENDAQVDVVDYQEQTPLLCAALEGRQDVVRILLEQNANADLADQNGRTPISVAAEQCLDDDDDDENYEASSDVMLEFDLEIDVNDNSAAIVSSLLAYGCDMHKRDTLGRSPLFYAVACGRLDIIILLESYSPLSFDTVDDFGNTLLSVAVRVGHRRITQYLLTSSSINPKEPDDLGRSCFWWAEKQGFSDVLIMLTKVLMSRGESIPADLVPVDQPSRILPRTSMRSCDVCLLGIVDGHPYSHCAVCNMGDFDICKDCVDLGAVCLSKTHKLERRNE